MPWSGDTFSRSTGVHTGPTAWKQTDDGGEGILSTRHDTHDQDLATGINTCLKKDGGNAATGNIPMGSNRITGLANGTARTDAIAVRQVQDGSVLWAGISSGADTITATLSPAIAAYVTGQRFAFLAGGTNTGAATINFNSAGAENLRKGADGSDALDAGDITSGGIYIVMYDGTNFQLLNPGTAGIGGDLLAANNLSDVANAATAFGNIKQAATTSATGVVEEATDAEVRAATDAKFLDAGHLSSAAATVALTDGATVAIDWTAGINFTLTVTANRTLGNPSAEIPGTFRTVLVQGDDATERTLDFGSEYGGEPPTLDDITSTKKYFLTIYCKSAGQFLVTAIDGSDA